MSDPRVFVPCPSCKGLSYYVVYERSANVAHVLCTGCDRELISVTMAQPEEPRYTGAAPI